MQPTVLFCEERNAVLKSFPGSVAYQIGETQFDDSAVGKVLKECAPLSGKNWLIFVERRDAGTLRYGVFRYLSMPTTPPFHDVLHLAANEVALAIRRTAPNVVEVKGSKGAHTNLIFSTARDDLGEDDSVPKFCQQCASGLEKNETTLEFQTYLGQLVQGCLTRSHGTMLACSDIADFANTPELKDRVLLDPALDFFSVYANYRRSNSAESLLDMQHLEELLLGLMNSDGIIVFDLQGKVIAYRAFFRPVEKGDVSGAAAVGGARRRAFEGIKMLVGKTLRAVLFRSQDGKILFKGGNA